MIARLPAPRLALVLAGCALCVLPGCDSSDGLSDLTGRWLSLNTAQFCQDGDIDVDLVVTASGSVSGAGTLQRWSGRCDGPPNQTITTYPVSVAGTATADGMDITFERTDVDSPSQARLRVDLTTCTSRYLSCSAAFFGGGLGEGDDDLTFFKTAD